MKHFTETSSEPYGRHIYKLSFKDGRSLFYDDYETLRATWFTNAAMKQLSHVDVLDRAKGFG